MNKFLVFAFGLSLILISCGGSEQTPNGTEENQPNNLVVEFEDASYLKIGDEVKSKGVVIGKVTKIDLSNNGQKVYVTLELKKGKQIPESSKLILAGCDVLGNKCIEIEFSESRTYYGINDTVTGTNELPIADSVIFDKFTGLFDSLLELTEHLDQDSLKASMDSTFNELFPE